MADFLTVMASASRNRVREAKSRVSEATLRRAAEVRPAPRVPSFHETGFDVIAEVKKHAPSAGRLHRSDAPTEFVASQAKAYAAGGAAAVSVLTEPTEFAGDIGDLSIAAGAVPIPIMRKDFLIDPYQVWEARAAGASGVLLIAAMLDPASLRDLLEVAGELKMFVLLELFSDREASLACEAREFALSSRASLLIGVNARDLRTLQVDSERFARISMELPSDVPWIAESGIDSVAAIRRVAGVGYRAALVGTALMRASDPTAMVASMVAAGRSEVMA